MDEVFPHTVFTLFGVVPVRDSVLHTWILVAVISVLAILASYRLRLRPTTRWQGLLEVAIESVSGLISGAIGEGHNGLVPFLLSLMFFTATANLAGLIPGLSTPTSDLNTAAALAIVVFFAVHIYGMKTLGWRAYLSKEFLTALVPLNIVGQLSRTLSLTLRLFGNMVAGTVIVAVLQSLVPLLAPLVLQALGILTGLIQAYVFTMLTLIYLGSAVEMQSSSSSDTQARMKGRTAAQGRADLTQ